MFTFDSKIRYSELASDGKLSLGAMINYFQDCSTFQSESLGVGMEALKAKKRAWFLSGWQIEIDRYPELLEEITVGTAAWDFQNFYGDRNFALMDREGKAFVRANAVWAYINTENGRAARPEPEEIAGYPIEKPLEMEYPGRKVSVSGEGVRQPELVVERRHIDTNGHMNNSWYVQLAAEYLPEGVRPGKIRVEYKVAFRQGQKILPVVYQEEGALKVALCNEQEKACAVVAFLDLREDL